METNAPKTAPANSDSQTQLETAPRPLLADFIESPAGQPVERLEPPDSQPASPAPAEPVTPFSTELSFVCLLIPRFRDHYLAGDLADFLPAWMKQACISYGWRLETISIRPGYVQWVMQVPLNANPARFMQLLRRHTSARIFEDFPRFKQVNISGEFWAPGNLVLPGRQLQTPEQVNEFIVQTRQYQGF